MLDKQDELMQVVSKLDEEGKSDVRDYGRVLLAHQQLDPPAPTPEEWSRCPRWLKLYILLVVFYHTSNRWVWESWLRLATGNYQRDSRK
jgi:hypothetical protein